MLPLLCEEFIGCKIAEAILERLYAVEKDLKSIAITWTGDNEYSNTKAADLADGSKGFCGCIAHILQIIVKKCFDNPVMAKCRKLIEKFNSSSQLLHKFKEIQRRNSMPVLVFVQDVVTRWMSSYHMVQRILQRKQALVYLHAELDMNRNEALNEVRLSNDEWMFLEAMMVILRCIADTQKRLEGEQYVTISLVVPYVQVIRGTLTIIEKILDFRSVSHSYYSYDDVPATERFISEEEFEVFLEIARISEMQEQLLLVVRGMISALENRFGDEKSGYYNLRKDGALRGDNNQRKGFSHFHLLGAALDPNVKLMGISPTRLDELWKFVKRKVVEFALEKDSTSSRSSDPSPTTTTTVGSLSASTKKVSGIDPLAMLASLNPGGAPVVNSRAVDRQSLIENAVDGELASYRSSGALGVDECGKRSNPIEWWQQNKLKFPYLAALAMVVLAIPASSASVERVFSLAGGVISDDRSRLKPDFVHLGNH